MGVVVGGVLVGVVVGVGSLSWACSLASVPVLASRTLVQDCHWPVMLLLYVIMLVSNYAK